MIQLMCNSLGPWKLDKRVGGCHSSSPNNEEQYDDSFNFDDVSIAFKKPQTKEEGKLTTYVVIDYDI
jgi:hypothetical protein